MPVSKVEKLFADEVLSSDSVEDDNPLKAAEKIAGPIRLGSSLAAVLVPGRRLAHRGDMRV